MRSLPIRQNQWIGALPFLQGFLLEESSRWYEAVRGFDTSGSGKVLLPHLTLSFLSCLSSFFFPWKFQSLFCHSSLCDWGGKNQRLCISNQFRESEVNFSNDDWNKKLNLEAKQAKDRFCKEAGVRWVCFTPVSCCGRCELSCRHNEMKCSAFKFCTNLIFT